MAQRPQVRTSLPHLWSLHLIEGRSAPGQTHVLMCLRGLAEGPARRKTCAHSPQCVLFGDKEQFVPEVRGGHGSFLAGGGIFADFYFIRFL